MDTFSRKAWKEGYKGRSVYKLKELNERYKLIRRNNRVLDLGCYPGSWIQYCNKINVGYILGVDVRDIKINGNYSFLKANVFDKEIFDKIKSFRSKFDVVLSDLAPITTGFSDSEKSLDLARKAFEIAQSFLCRGGNFLCKVFQSNGLENFIMDLKKYFDFVKVTKPRSSKKRSSEIYIVAKNFKYEN